MVLLGIIAFHTAEPEILLQFSPQNAAAGALTGGFPVGARKPARQIASNANLDGQALNGRFVNPATPQPFRPLQFSNRPSSASAQTCVRLQIALSISPVKTMSFNQMKRQEAESRMAAIRRSRRSPAAAAAQQRRASLVGDGAKWRITNLNQVARAIARWA